MVIKQKCNRGTDETEPQTWTACDLPLYEGAIPGCAAVLRLHIEENQNLTLAITRESAQAPEATMRVDLYMATVSSNISSNRRLVLASGTVGLHGSFWGPLPLIQSLAGAQPDGNDQSVQSSAVPSITGL
jgi:hypothetical protein